MNNIINLHDATPEEIELAKSIGNIGQVKDNVNLINFNFTTTHEPIKNETQFNFKSNDNN